MQQETAIQINGSLVIVPPTNEHELIQLEHSKNVATLTNGDLVITSIKEGSDPTLAHSSENSSAFNHETLARNGEIITNNEFDQNKNSCHSILKMTNGFAYSKRYNPLHLNLTPDSKVSIIKKHNNNQTAKENRSSETTKRKLFSEDAGTSKKSSKMFVCNFCDRIFNSLEYLQSHHEIHGITYWIRPYSWMDEETLPQHTDQDSNMNDLCFVERLQNHENIYEGEGFTCQVCDMIFASVGGLSKHMDIHRISDYKSRIVELRESISEEGHTMIDLTD
ncbi:zinc finger protein 816 [Halyomorpha halys]|uniref:zinc finger protein 816 n=1 Tax=Halyomorpha halys TaxID=286706 RepID=UPI0006D52066|nr:zinc finger protein 888 [Halyomorpha halys]XP_014287613.1 zinc finger protein 888 [Halyomorpha halys]XP_014287614.1 zinc finger protein 888 [Halyomorpha halys]